jgi:hypothetical protein
VNWYLGFIVGALTVADIWAYSTGLDRSGFKPPWRWWLKFVPFSGFYLLIASTNNRGGVK